MLYRRYRIDATNYIRGIAHDAGHIIETEWHDSEESAVTECAAIADAYPDDDDLVLAIHEYHIEADAEPSGSDWNAVRTRQPSRVVEEQNAREWAAPRDCEGDDR